MRFKGLTKAKRHLHFVHERLVNAYPEQVDAPNSEPMDNKEAARRVFAAFLPKAYRRPVSKEGNREAVVGCNVSEESTMATLIWNRFDLDCKPCWSLRSFFIDQKTKTPMVRSMIMALASRLSYFLWSTMPDDELRDLSDQGKLRNEEVSSSRYRGCWIVRFHGIGRWIFWPMAWIKVPEQNRD